MADDRPNDDDRPRRDAKVPETWRGYLGEEEARRGGRDEDELSPEEREFLERNLRPDAGREESLGPGQPPPAPARSRSEGVSFAGLIPFFIALIAVLIGAFAFGYQFLKPKPYDISSFGPPDRTIEVVAREFFRTSGSATMSPDLFVDDVEAGQMRLRHTLGIFGRSMAQRYAEALDALKGGKYQVVDPEPTVSPESEAAAHLDYDRTDLTTNAQTVERLWFGRTPAGWRIVGFE